MRDKENILAIAGSKKAPLVLELKDYNGSNLIDIRKYFTDKKSGELAPTRKGISLTEVQYQVLVETLNVKSNEIADWFNQESSEYDINTKSYEENKSAEEEYSVEVSSWKGMEMSKYHQEGGKRTLVLNEEHPWISKLLQLTANDINNPIFLHFVSLFQSFHRSESLIDSKNSDAQEVIETLKGNWDLYCKISLGR